MGRNALLAVPGGPSALVGEEPPGSSDPRGTSVARWHRARSMLDQRSQGLGDGRLIPPAGPLAGELAELLPWGGLRRGSTVVVRGSTSLLLALLAASMTGGSWAAVVGMPDLGLVAAAELGVAVHRLALVPRPGAEFGPVVAALLDGVDLVVLATDAITRSGARGAQLARRLSARARHRGGVLLAFGSWPGADLELDCSAVVWSGLGLGHGYLAGCRLAVTARGRGAAARPRHALLRLWGEDPAESDSEWAGERAVG